MEDGRWPIRQRPCEVCQGVLILVLMEDGLGPSINYDNGYGGQES